MTFTLNRRNITSVRFGVILRIGRTRRTSHEPWLKTSAVAEHCGVTDQTVRAYVKAGLLHPKKTPGGHYRFDPAEVDALLAEIDTSTEINHSLMEVAV